MQSIEQIRTYFHRTTLHKELSGHRIKRSSMYLDNATSIGILFDGTTPSEREIVLDFAEQMKKQGKKVKLLAFFNNKLKSDNFAFPVFNRLQLDWTLRPVSREALEFKEQVFDLLLNLTKQSVLPLDYIAAHSKAKFRVGPLTEAVYCYDLMIDHTGKSDLKNYLQQVVSYLKKMQPNYATAAI